MKIKFVLFFFLLFTCTTTFAQNAEKELAKIKADIAKQEKELQNLQNSQSDIIQQVSLIKRKIENEKRALSIINNQISKNTKLIKEKKILETELDKKSKRLKDEMELSLMFLVNSGDHSAGRAFFISDNISDNIAVMEVVEHVTLYAAQIIKDYNALAIQSAEVRKEIEGANAQLLEQKSEKSALAANLTKTEKLLNNKLAVVKNDMKARTEYLQMLKKEQERLNQVIKKVAKTPTITDKNSMFFKSKGALPWPMQGKLIDRFGEKLIAEAGVTIFHKGIKIAPFNDYSSVTPVYQGRVEFADYIHGLENVVIVSHDDLYYTIYGNLSLINVQVSDIVSSKDILGQIEVDYDSGDGYLYFEIRRGEIAVDPLSWLIRR